MTFRRLPAVLPAIVMLACLDLTPLRGKDAPRDAATDVAPVDGAWKTACHTCIETAPECGYAACKTDSRCVAFDACIVDHGCIALGDLNARIACGQPCFQSVGIKDFTDPSLTLYYPVNGCTTYPTAGSTQNAGVCAAACVLK